MVWIVRMRGTLVPSLLSLHFPIAMQTSQACAPTKSSMPWVDPHQISEWTKVIWKRCVPDYAFCLIFFYNKFQCELLNFIFWLWSQFCFQSYSMNVSSKLQLYFPSVLSTMQPHNIIGLYYLWRSSISSYLDRQPHNISRTFTCTGRFQPSCRRPDGHVCTRFLNLYVISWPGG